MNVCDLSTVKQHVLVAEITYSVFPPPQALNQHISWDKGLSQVIKPSPLVEASRKRKRCDSQEVDV